MSHVEGKSEIIFCEGSYLLLIQNKKVCRKPSGGKKKIVHLGPFSLSNSFVGLHIQHTVLKG